MFNQRWVSRTARFCQYLFCGLITFMLLHGLAWGADVANRLTAVSLDPASATPTVLIETADPVGYRYTVYDSFEPTRVVVDFPGMESSDIPEKISIDQGNVQEVRVAGFQLSSGQLTRVEIILAVNSEYQINLDGKQFRVAFADGAAAAPAETAEVKIDDTPVAAPAMPPVAPAKADQSNDADVLQSIALSKGQAVIEANGKIGKFLSFSLDNPPRLVIDLYGLKPAFKTRSFPAEAGFKNVRVGIYDNKTRLVFDASEKNLPAHSVVDRTTDLLVSWDSESLPQSDEVKEAQKAAVAEPVEVASPMEVAPVVVAEQPVAEPAAVEVVGRAAKVEAIDFSNEDGRSVVTVTLSEKAKVLEPIQEGNLVRFEIVNATISRALRRTIDASAFPSAVTSVVPYTVTEDNHQNVRVAVNLKGPVAYALEQDDSMIRFVIDDGAYAEPVPPAVSQVEVVAPEATASDMVEAPTEQMFAPTSVPVTADEMAAEADRYTGEKITLVFDSANVRSILQLIGDVSGLNILASSDVGGTVTLRLIDVPWDQALDLLLETTNLGKLQQGNVLRIMPKDKIREIEQTDMKEQMIAIEEGVLETKLFPISYASVDDMKGFLTDIASDRGSIIADSRNKQLIVRDVAAVLEQMAEMISQIDKPERQVMIEARVVEANTNFSRELGVQWRFDYNQDGVDGTESFSVDSITNVMGGGGALAVSPTAAGIGTALTFGALESQLDIDLRLKALETSGEGKIVSTPRITTLNGEKATISQGTKIPYSTVSDAGTDVTFENAELKLDVTPEINPDGSILLDIQVANSSVGSEVPTATGTAVSIDEKKAQSKVLVRNGQTTVIGGIFIETELEGQTGVPVLMNVPFFGKLFREKSTRTDRRELLIFITPRIVDA